MLFGSTMPLCWIILLVNKMIELRLMINDNSKQQRRTEPQQRCGLGFWNNINNILMYSGCIVNYGILCFVSNAHHSNAPNNFSGLIKDWLLSMNIENVDDLVIKTLMYVVIQNLFVILIIIANSSSNLIHPRTKLIEMRANHAIRCIEEQNK